MCAQCGSTISATRPIDDAYLYLYPGGGAYTRLAPEISTQITLRVRRRVIPTTPHPGLAKAIGLLYGSSNSFRKLGAERAKGRDADKNIVGAELPFCLFYCLPPSSFSFYLISIHLLPATAKESVGAFVSGKRHLVNFGVKECFW